MFSATRDIRTEGDFLVYEPDAKLLRLCRRRNRDRLPVEEYLAAVRLKNSVDHIHQGGFSGPVLSRDCMDLAAAQLEIHSAQRLDGAEGLAEIRYLQNDFGRHDRKSPIIVPAIKSDDSVSVDPMNRCNPTVSRRCRPGTPEAEQNESAARTSNDLRTAASRVSASRLNGSPCRRSGRTHRRWPW